MLQDNRHAPQWGRGGATARAQAGESGQGIQRPYHFARGDRHSGCGHKAALCCRQVLQRRVEVPEPDVGPGHVRLVADFLKKDGSHFELIEVKSKSYDSANPECRFVGKRGGMASEWREYLEDVVIPPPPSGRIAATCSK
jgi:hypothetical protein